MSNLRLVAGAGLLLSALLAAGCTNAPSPPTTTTTLQASTSTSTTVSTTSTSAGPASATTTTLEHVLSYSADYGSETLRASSLVSSAEAILMGTVIDGPDSRWNGEDGKQWTPKSPEDGPQFYTTWLIRVEESLKGPYGSGRRRPFTSTAEM